MSIEDLISNGRYRAYLETAIGGDLLIADIGGTTMSIMLLEHMQNEHIVSNSIRIAHVMSGDYAGKPVVVKHYTHGINAGRMRILEHDSCGTGIYSTAERWTVLPGRGY